MKKEATDKIAEEMVRHHLDRETNPEQQAAYKINLEHYTNQRQFEAEREFFHHSPLLMGFSTDMPEVGNVKTNEFLDTPILLTRTKSGEVKAFANMCRHRGARLVDEPTSLGKRRNLSCPYHGWVYGLDGKLKSVANENLFGHIDKNCHGLLELPCEEKHGMIFVRPTAGKNVSVDDHLGAELSNELAAWDFAGLHFVDSTIIDTNSSWKLAIDTFLENYHVEYLHKNTIGGLALSGWEMVNQYGPHQRMAFPQSSISKYLDDAPEDRVGHKHLSMVYNIFPNILIVYGYLWVQYFEVYPGKTIGEQNTRFSLYCRKPMLTEEHKEGARRYFDLNMDFVPVEDFLMSRQVTQSVFSGAQKYHLFGHCEKALTHFHRNIRSSVGLNPDDLFYVG